MKKTIAVIALLTIAHYVNAQWESQNPKPSDSPLYDIQFIDENHGWAVGEYGTILHSSNGGKGWVEQYCNEGFQMGYFTFLSVHFIDLDNGWAVGRYGNEYVVANTSNGGAWWMLTGGGGYTFLDVVFTDTDNGCVTATSTEGDGYILHSGNGGISWDVKHSAI